MIRSRSRHACDNYESDHYKKLLPYIDSFSPIKERELIDELDAVLLSVLIEKKLDNVNLVIPFLIDHAEYNQFTVTGLGRAAKERLAGEFPSVEQIIDTIHSLGSVGDDDLITVEDLQKKYKNPNKKNGEND